MELVNYRLFTPFSYLWREDCTPRVIDGEPLRALVLYGMFLDPQVGFWTLKGPEILSALVRALEFVKQKIAATSSKDTGAPVPSKRPASPLSSGNRKRKKSETPPLEGTNTNHFNSKQFQFVQEYPVAQARTGGGQSTSPSSSARSAARNARARAPMEAQESPIGTVGSDVRLQQRDRKSTRLNSSHWE